MKFNRRIGRDDETGPGTLGKEDIINVLRRLSIFVMVGVRSMISIIWVIAVSDLLVKWPKTNLELAWYV